MLLFTCLSINDGIYDDDKDDNRVPHIRVSFSFFGIDFYYSIREAIEHQV